MHLAAFWTVPSFIRANITDYFVSFSFSYREVGLLQIIGYLFFVTFYYTFLTFLRNTYSYNSFYFNQQASFQSAFSSCNIYEFFLFIFIT